MAAPCIWTITNKMSLMKEIADLWQTKRCVPLDWQEERLAVSTKEISVYRKPDSWWAYKLNQSESLVWVEASPDYQQISKCLPADGSAEGSALQELFLLRTAFECRFCYEGIVSLHAACVEVGDFAVAFTGHSGLGKSTRAKAWVDGLGARWISGDRPAVRLEKQGSTACGVPWDGKEQIFRDVEVPLKCIMEVRRSPLNYVRRPRRGSSSCSSPSCPCGTPMRR